MWNNRLHRSKSYPILIKGLQRLEYRGYDSAGVALQNGSLHVYKKKGKVAGLVEFTAIKTSLVILAWAIPVGPPMANRTIPMPTPTAVATAAGTDSQRHH